jgi:hypothetical protein
LKIIFFFSNVFALFKNNYLTVGHVRFCFENSFLAIKRVRFAAEKKNFYLICSLLFENNLLTIEGVCVASISKKTPLLKLSFAFISISLPLLVHIDPKASTTSTK